MNPYAAQDRAQQEREQDADAFTAWCDANDRDEDDAARDAYNAERDEYESSRY